MARCPFASWRPLNESEPAITPRTVIYHTMVGTLPSTDRFFRSGTSLESHFGVGGPWEGAEFDGAIWQWVDTERQADANLNANDYAISIETSDGGDPNRPWTPKQLDSLIRLGLWAAETHNIPRRQSRSCSDPAGFGWHVMHGAPSCWTPIAKSCPGSVRINQLKTIVFPAIFAGAPPQEEDLNTEQAAQLKWIHDQLRFGHVPSGTPLDNLFVNANNTHDAIVVPGTNTAAEAFELLFNRVRAIADAVGATSADDPDVDASLESVRERLEAIRVELLDAIAALSPPTA